MLSFLTAGVMFTANPITNNRESIKIDASWGLGESIGFLQKFVL